MSQDTTITNALENIKKEYENAIKTDGSKGAHSMIRSQKMIRHIHEFIKNELISNGINPDKINPRLCKSKGEISLTGFLKSKKQDVTVLPDRPKPETINDGFLIGKTDKVGKDLSSKSISINIRSQLSSLGKNFDSLYERTFAEAINLHGRTPELVMGEVYMVPLIAYNPDEIKSKKIAFNEKLPANYIPSFRALNGRTNVNSEEYKYERVCLLIVDFRNRRPKIITKVNELVKEGIVPRNKKDKFSLVGLDIQNFVSDLLKSYKKRHGSLRALE